MNSFSATSLSNDDALKRALSLAVPVTSLGSTSAYLVLRAVKDGGENLLKVAGGITGGTVRTAWTVAKTAGAGADFVNRNVLAPAVSRVNPLQGFGQQPIVQEQPQAKAVFVQSHSRAVPAVHTSKANQQRKVQSHGFVRCKLQTQPQFTLMQHPDSAAELWSMSLALQSSML